VHVLLLEVVFRIELLRHGLRLDHNRLHILQHLACVLGNAGKLRIARQIVLLINFGSDIAPIDDGYKRGTIFVHCWVLVQLIAFDVWAGPVAERVEEFAIHKSRSRRDRIFDLLSGQI